MNGKTGMYVGIIISVVIVLAIVGISVGLYAFKGNAIGEPVATKDPAKLEKIEMTLDLARLINMPSGGGAEVPYNEAVKLAMEYGDNFAEDAGKPFPEENEKLKAILVKLEEAAEMGMGSDVKLVFSSLPEMSPKTEWEIRGTLYAIAKIAAYASMARNKNGDLAGAEKAMRAGLLWGYRLFKNGDDFVAYKYAGVCSVSEALGAAMDLYMKGDATKKAAADDLNKEYRKAGDRWFDKVSIILKPDLKINAADLWNMAENDKDKAWRREGVMWLGVSQWTYAFGPQRPAVQKYLESLTHSPDPVIAKLAKEAYTMKREDMNAVAFNLPR
ncbi:MAG: hypothetical protein FWD61_02250 [Phycisphaerales bacterium]|nr:hypothetical protein [Phycisphaerales bacterium]